MMKFAVNFDGNLLLCAIRKVTLHEGFHRTTGFRSFTENPEVLQWGKDIALLGRGQYGKNGSPAMRERTPERKGNRCNAGQCKICKTAGSCAARRNWLRHIQTTDTRRKRRDRRIRTAGKVRGFRTSPGSCCRYFAIPDQFCRSWQRKNKWQ